MDEHIFKLIEEYNLTIKKEPDKIDGFWYTHSKNPSKESGKFLPDLQFFIKRDPKFGEKNYENFYNTYPEGKTVEKRTEVSKRSGKWIVSYEKSFGFSTLIFRGGREGIFVSDSLEEAVKQCVEYVEELRKNSKEKEKYYIFNP